MIAEPLDVGRDDELSTADEDFACDGLTVEEFDGLVRRGIVDRESGIELIDGALVSYAPPPGGPHEWAALRLSDVARERLRGRAFVWEGHSVIVSENTWLVPDVSILAPRDAGYGISVPQASDVRCVVEVADSSVRRDRTTKLALYARAGIPEYWIVNVRWRRIELYRAPCGGRYRDRRVAVRGERVAFAAFPDAVFGVDEILG